MAQQPFKPLRGRTIRITNLDDCCTPPVEDTECAVSVFDAATVVTITPNVEEGESAFEKKANGDICVNEKDPDLLRDLTVSITFCQVLPEVISALTSWPVVRDADDRATGFDIMQGASEGSTGLEIFTGVAGIDCGQGARYGYGLVPCVGGWQIDGDVQLFAGIDQLFTLTINGTASANHAWGIGPYDVQADADGNPGPLLDPIQQGALARIMTTQVPPPAVTDGCVAASAEVGYTWPRAVAPALASIDPATGPEAGGTTVTLTGSGFLEGN